MGGQLCYGEEYKNHENKMCNLNNSLFFPIACPIVWLLWQRFAKLEYINKQKMTHCVQLESR